MLIEDFIARWKDTEGSERANKDSFLRDLCRALGVREPDGKTGDPDKDHYIFEADAVLYDENRKRHVGWMDLYKTGCFVLEAKQGSTRTGKKTGTARRGTEGWALAMHEAQGQAIRYARTLEVPPPFLIVTDIGYCFDLYSCFDGSGHYRPYPNNQKSRLFFKDLSAYADTLRSIWLDPHSLDTAKRSQAVTIEVSAKLADLAKMLEKRHEAEVVGRFLMRCVFCMFAEDIGLLRDKIFTRALETTWIPNPSSFGPGVEALWDAMNDGKNFFILGKLLHFNGGLFKNPQALALEKHELEILLEAAKKEWSEVQPAIFGTLIESALDPAERHKLGAHFTPTSYVERLLKPTIEDPLRDEWEVIKAQVRDLVPPNEEPKKASLAKARESIREFHRKLCETIVLDPACGSGNFLYLALDLMKRLESEVLAMLYDLGDRQLNVEDRTVNPSQFRGLEIRSQSKDAAELVLWIGYLQWHHRMYGQTKNPPEPILRDYKNIECRDALLAYDSKCLAQDESGNPITRWDEKVTKTHPVTGKAIPDNSRRTPVYEYQNPRKAAWPRADFIVGNPPFLGKLHLLDELGPGYVTALRKVYEGEVPDGVDFVMYWWARAAREVANHAATRSGLVTTKAITQSLNRRVVSAALNSEVDAAVSLAFGIPNHPWIGESGGAAVRIAMTVLARGSGLGRLGSVVREAVSDEGSSEVELTFAHGTIQDDLRIGAAVSAVTPLRANQNLASMGPMLGSRGFVVDDALRARLIEEDGASLEPKIRPLRNGRDYTDRCRGLFAIDLNDVDATALTQWPATQQHLRETAYAERQHNKDPKLRKYWWNFRRTNELYRAMLRDLDRFIVTVETAKHRLFFFEQAGVITEHGTIAVGLNGGEALGILSSRIHVVWALAAGGRLGVGNDPRYNKTRCFDPFPFPTLSPELKERIEGLGEALDSHRKRQQRRHPGLTLTGMYNVLEKLRAGDPLTEKEKTIYEHGLISVLQQLHEEIDAAVFEAYGWSQDLSDDQILDHVVALNRERVAEEAADECKWLRRGFQEQFKVDEGRKKRSTTKEFQLSFTWPADLPGQVTTVRNIIDASSVALSASDVAAVCSGATAAKVIPVLETLEALAHVVSFNDTGKRWISFAQLGNDRPGLKKASSRPPADSVRSA